MNDARNVSPRRVVLVGTNHRHQLVGTDEGRPEEFGAFLEATVRDYGPDLLAEELSEQVLTESEAKDSTLRELAQRLGLPHIFCDPTREERERLGIKLERDCALELFGRTYWPQEENARLRARFAEEFPRRERYWLERLLARDFASCIFVLGASHVDSFAELLGAEGIDVACAARDWGEVATVVMPESDD